MSDQLKEQNRQIAGLTALLGSVLVYRVFLDTAYWYVLAGTIEYVPPVFAPMKYAVSLLWCLVLFLGVRHQKKKASSFLMAMFVLLQIFPISTIYALGDENSLYYHAVCAATLLAEIFLGWTEDRPYFQRNAFLSKVMHLSLAGCIVGILVLVVVQNGAPSLIALDIYKVYELRSSGSFQIGKYPGYIFNLVTKVCIPLFIGRCIYQRRYVTAAVLCGIQGLLYLYTGHKTFLFSIPLVVMMAILTQWKRFYQGTLHLYCWGVSALCAMPLLAPLVQQSSDRLYTMMMHSYTVPVCRCLMNPAMLKFQYYDYFRQRPRMGLAGIFPRWLVPIQNPYAGIDYQHEIGGLYLGKYETNANTGFLAEGYYRFGFLGIFLLLIFFALILKWADSLQDRLGYGLTVTFLLYPVFSLADGRILSELFIGTWMLILVYMAFYSGTGNSGRRLQKRRHSGYRLTQTGSERRGGAI